MNSCNISYTSFSPSPLSVPSTMASTTYPLDSAPPFGLSQQYPILSPPPPTDISQTITVPVPLSISASDSTLRPRRPRRHFLAPYTIPSPSPPTPIAPATHHNHTPVVVPSNVYAPQTLPLHTPQPVSGFSPLSSLADASSTRLCPLKTDSPLSDPRTNSHLQPSILPDLPPSKTFPTPSELLSELTQRDASAPKEVIKKTRKRKSQPDMNNANDGYTPTDP